MTAPGCTLYLDGNRVADGAATDDPLEVTALSGLQVSWGRQTTVDQPASSSCTFNLMDLPGHRTFADLVHVGSAIQVRAAAVTPAPPDVPANLDPSFEAAALGSAPEWITTGSQTSIVNDQAATGTQSAIVRFTDPAYSGGNQAVIPPDAFSTDPAAWNPLPTIQPGQDWTGSAAILAPPYTALTVTIAALVGPTFRGWSRLGPATSSTAGLDPVWQTTATAATNVPGPAGWFGGTLITAAFATWNDYPAAATTWNDVPTYWSWSILADLRIDDVPLLVSDPSDSILQEVVVFDGRVTDLQAGFDDTFGGVNCYVTAADFTADLGQHDVTVPAAGFPAQTVAARFAAILAAAAPPITTIPYTIDPAPAAATVGWFGADSENGQVLPMLQDLATSTDAVLWSATHRTTGPYLHLVDPRSGAALYQLTLDGSDRVVVTPTSAAGNAIDLDACDVLLDPVVYNQTTSDVATRVAVSWQNQTVDDTGAPAPTAVVELVIDPTAELQLGRRRVEVASQLTTAAAARIVAQQLLARLVLQSWRVAGLVWRTDAGILDDDRIGRVLALLDGTRRLALPVILSNLPGWTPGGASTLPLIVQGGIYTFEQGQWTLELTTSSAAAQGASLPWNAVNPGWAWTRFSTSVRYIDLIGVSA